MEMETAGRIFTGGGNDFYRNIQRTADIRKEPKGQPVNMNILRIATPL